MKKEVVMNHYLKAILMGEQIFGIYYEKTDTQKLKDMINDFKESFQHQREQLKKVFIDKKMKIEEECTFLQKEAVFMERLKTKKLKDDYDLCIQMIKSMNQAIVGALKYYRKIEVDTKKEFKKEIKNIMSNYENIVGKIKNLVLENTTNS